MANLGSCFFCCENISPENKIVEESDHFNGPLNSVDCDTYSSSSVTDYKTIKESVLQIAHYLKVPKTLINCDETSVLKTCPKCSEISTNLKNFCVQLEIIKMEISHYLNLLTDRIIEPSGESDRKQDQSQNLSNFQKIFHQKCLQKVRSSEKTFNPQICLRKCPNPPQVPVQDLKSEKIPNYPEMEEEPDLEDQIKLEDDPTISTLPTNEVFSDELHSCPFCTFIVNGQYEELHSHISIEHPEHFQTGEEETSSVPTPNPDDQQNETLSNLNGQRRNFECSNCKRRYTRKDYLKYHLKSVCKTGIMIDHESGQRVTSLPNNSSKEKREYKFTKCEYCGMLVYQKNLQRHLDRKHSNGNNLSGKRKEKTCEICGVPFGNSGNFRNHMLVAHGVKMPEKIKMYKCDTCDKSFEMKRSLKRHLEKNVKCRLRIKGKLVVRKPVKIQMKPEEEPVLFLSISEPNEDTYMVYNEVGVNVEEDPLKI